jgi:hypothetical protein
MYSGCSVDQSACMYTSVMDSSQRFSKLGWRVKLLLNKLQFLKANWGGCNHGCYEICKYGCCQRALSPALRNLRYAITNPSCTHSGGQVQIALLDQEVGRSDLMELNGALSVNDCSITSSLRFGKHGQSVITGGQMISCICSESNYRNWKWALYGDVAPLGKVTGC